MKNKKTTGTSIFILRNSRLGDLAPEVEIYGKTKSPPAADAEVITLTTEQNISAAELHSEPRAPVSCTINLLLLTSHSFFSVARVPRFRNIESRRLFPQLQGDATKRSAGSSTTSARPTAASRRTTSWRTRTCTSPSRRHRQPQGLRGPLGLRVRPLRDQDLSFGIRLFVSVFKGWFQIKM